MKALTLTKLTVSLLLVAMSPYAKAASLSGKDIQNIRSVLRGMNVDERYISNSQLEMLHKQGSPQFDQHQQEYNNRLDGQEIQMTCGGGSHGSDRDPV